MIEQEENLVANAVAGDREALEELLELHYPALLGRVRQAIGRAYRRVLDPEDVLQVSYMEAFLRIRHFRWNGPGSFFGWLVRIAQNNLSDAIRWLDRDKREPRGKQVRNAHGTDSYAGLLANLAESGTTPSGHATREEITEAMQAAIDRMPELYRMMVCHIDLKGESAKEVAKRIGRTRAAVYMLRQRAHDLLAELLGESTNFFAGRRVQSAVE